MVIDAPTRWIAGTRLPRGMRQSTRPGRTRRPTADAVTRASSDIMSGYTAVGKIVFRCSASCNAAWARAAVTSGSSYLRAEITRSSPCATSQAESTSPIDALRSPVLAVTPGSSFTAVGKIGSNPGIFQFSGAVRTNF
ncbi:hypothetical protein predicted by Glimmer/Critica [Sorangium cellulosum So ce56]|uniref:Uncharacterized protein n=1 Tax=Sorangium cellulosum (strain So ce56) TaxID=448385 RepID=A9GLI1_SORC5|nr:hypothetical protein predicted by Glimmer/Critica [Sorangium cellulosum So ce56]